MSRVHIIAVVVGLSETGASDVTIDDGTGKVIARSFENPQFFRDIQLGDIVRVIGRVRSFHEQIYLIPEIMKKITNKIFITLHKLLLQRLEKQELIIPDVQVVSEMDELIEKENEENVEEIAVDADDTVPSSPFDTLINVIKRLDNGDGAQIETIIQEAGQESEKIIHHMLETGEIFEIRPGRIKLLD